MRNFRAQRGPRGPRNRLANLDNPSSEFARWRATCGFTQNQAAEVLAASTRTVQSWEAGKLLPDRNARIVMRLYAERIDIPIPWPER